MKQLSRDLNHSPSYIQKMISLNAKKLPDLEQILELCDFFKISLHEFFDLYSDLDSPEDSSPSLYTKLTKEQRQRVFQALNTLLSIKSE